MWKKISCAVQGRSHIANNIPCQDKTYCLQANGVEIIALADGAGSARLSHLGAQAAVETTAAILAEKFDRLYNGTPNKFSEILINSILDRLESLRQQHDCSLKDLSSTLLVVAIKDDRYLLAHLGDGVIGYIKNDVVALASAPQNGEFANTTFFTTSRQARQVMTTMRGKLGDITGFILLSDGSENSFYNKRQKSLARAVNDLFDYNTLYPQAIFQTQLEDDFNNIIKNMTSDDCSMSMISLCNQDTMTGVLEKVQYSDKTDLFNIKRPGAPVSRRRVKRFEKIVALLADKCCSLPVISRTLHLKDKYTKKQLAYLQQARLVENNNGQYYLAG